MASAGFSFTIVALALVFAIVFPSESQQGTEKTHTNMIGDNRKGLKTKHKMGIEKLRSHFEKVQANCTEHDHKDVQHHDNEDITEQCDHYWNSYTKNDKSHHCSPCILNAMMSHMNEERKNLTLEVMMGG